MQFVTISGDIYYSKLQQFRESFPPSISHNFWRHSLLQFVTISEYIHSCNLSPFPLLQSVTISEYIHSCNLSQFLNTSTSPSCNNFGSHSLLQLVTIFSDIHFCTISGVIKLIHGDPFCNLLQVMEIPSAICYNL